MRLVVGISGASGIILAQRFLEACPHPMDVIISPGALHTAQLEIGLDRRTPQSFLSRLSSEARERITLHPIGNLGATIASGSYPTRGMVILPCSMATVAAISIGLGDNLLRRAADVTLKEQRRLVLVPRETPLSAIHLENLLKLSRLGVCIVPPVPAWYQHPSSVVDIENGIVGRVLDALEIPHQLYAPWKGSFPMSEIATEPSPHAARTISSLSQQAPTPDRLISVRQGCQTLL